MKYDQEPGWFTIEGAAAWSGLSTRTIERLITDKLITSKNVKRPGKSRGCRLIKRESLNAYIESCGDETTELAMNTKQNAGGLKLMSHIYSGTAPALLNAAQLAPLLGITDTTVRKLCKEGVIPAEIKEGRIYRFDPAKVRKALADRAPKPTP